MPPASTEIEITHVPANEWAVWAQSNDAVVIDVREPIEWAQGTLPNCDRVSLANLPTAVATMDPSRAVLLVCATGARSTVGATWMTSIGFSNAASMAGGVKALGMI